MAANPKPKPKSKSKSPRRTAPTWTCPNLGRRLTATHLVAKGASRHLFGVLVRAQAAGRSGHDWWVLWRDGACTRVDPRTGIVDGVDWRMVRLPISGSKILWDYVIGHYLEVRAHAGSGYYIGAKALDGQIYADISIPSLGAVEGDARWRVAISSEARRRFMVWLHYVARSPTGGGYSTSVGVAYPADTIAEAHAVQAQMLAWIADQPARSHEQPALRDVADAMPKTWPAMAK